MIGGFIKQRCPKCGGNIYIDTDYYLEGGLISWQEQVSCLQCGYVIYDFEELAGNRNNHARDTKTPAGKEPSLV